MLSFIVVALATLAWALTAHAAAPSIDSSFAMVHYYFTGSKIPHLNAKVISSVSLRDWAWVPRKYAYFKYYYLLRLLFIKVKYVEYCQ